MGKVPAELWGICICGQEIEHIWKITSGFLDVLLPVHKHTDATVK